MLWAGYVLVASTVDPPTAGVPTTGPLGLVGFDKWLHALSYGAMAGLVAYAVLARDARAVVLAVAAAVAFGAGVEVIQDFLPYRAFDVDDMLANAVGAVLGGLGWTVLTAYLTLPGDRGGFTGASGSESR